MTEKNIRYTTPAISDFFSRNRIRWMDFYESERRVIAGLGLGRTASILDVGCGCGGLGLALFDEFGVEEYTGVEINPQAAAAGRSLNPRATILCGDVLDLTRTELLDLRFDAVFSLSCVDWNVRFADMLAAAWTHVRPRGYLVSTFRLTPGVGCDDFDTSHQFINFDGQLEGEAAPYVVLNAGDLMARLQVLEPAAIRAYGYWGVPSATAVTPYDKLCFAAFALQKGSDDRSHALELHLDLPEEVRSLMKIKQARTEMVDDRSG